MSREIVPGCLAFIDALGLQIDRLDSEVRARANAGPRVKVLTAPRRGAVVCGMREVGLASVYQSAPVVPPGK